MFPASRFPFEARGDVSDSRAGGDYLGTDYQSRRFSVSQSYRPPAGRDSYNVTYDYSALSSSRLPDDTVRSILMAQFQAAIEEHGSTFGRVTIFMGIGGN